MMRRASPSGHLAKYWPKQCSATFEVDELDGGFDSHARSCARSRSAGATNQVRSGDVSVASVGIQALQRCERYLA